MRNLVFRRSLLEPVTAAGSWGVRGPEALRKGVGSQEPEPARKPLLELRLQRVIRAGNIAGDVAKAGESWERASRLHASRTGIGYVERIIPLNVRPLVS